MKRAAFLAALLLAAAAAAGGFGGSSGGTSGTGMTSGAQTFTGLKTFSDGVATSTVSASGLFTSTVASGSVAFSLTSGARLTFGSANRYISDDGSNIVIKGSVMPSATVSWDFGDNARSWGSFYLWAIVLNSGQIRDSNSIARISLSTGSIDLGNPIKTSADTLATCASGTEGEISRDTSSGGTTGHRTRLCLCTSDGAGTPGYKWQNMGSASLGTTTTCPD